MATFKCWDITSGFEETESSPGLAVGTPEAYDAQSAAEEYAMKCWWDAGCDGTERTVLIESDDGKRTTWHVCGEPVMVWTARATLGCVRECDGRQKT